MLRLLWDQFASEKRILAANKMPYVSIDLQLPSYELTLAKYYKRFGFEGGSKGEMEITRDKAIETLTDCEQLYPAVAEGKELRLAVAEATSQRSKSCSENIVSTEMFLNTWYIDVPTNKFLNTT